MCVRLCVRVRAEEPCGGPLLTQAFAAAVITAAVAVGTARQHRAGAYPTQLPREVTRSCLVEDETEAESGGP